MNWIYDFLVIYGPLSVLAIAFNTAAILMLDSCQRRYIAEVNEKLAVRLRETPEVIEKMIHNGNRIDNAMLRRDAEESRLKPSIN